MLNKLEKLKKKAFEDGSSEIINLENALASYISNQTSDDTKEYVDKFIGLNAIEITDWLYEQSAFHNYMQYSFLGKYYEKKIDLIKSSIILIAVLIGIILYLIFKIGIIFIVGCIALIVLLIIIFEKFETGESYDSYYKRTIYKFLLEIYGIGFNINKPQAKASKK